MSRAATWQIGFGLAEITPDAGADAGAKEGVSLSGFAARSGPAQGVHDPLFVRALSVGDGARDAAVLVFDLIGVDSALTASVRRAVEARTDLDGANLAVLATHTHGGPAVLTRAHLGAPRAGYRRRLCRAAADAVEAALAGRRPMRVRVAVGREASVAVNRRAAAGPVDPELPVVRFDPLDGPGRGRPAGLLVSYACHPVVLGPDNLLLTRDYPGAVVDALEQTFPDAFVLFATGCCGQINTGHKASDSLTTAAAPRRSFPEAHRLGRRLAGAAAEAVRTLDGAEGGGVRGELRVLRATTLLPLDDTPAPDAELATWRTELAALGGSDPARAAVLRALIAWGESVGADAADRGADAADRSVEVEVMVVALGDLCLAIYPGEVFVEFGLELKARFAGRPVIPLAYGNAAPGYLPHRSAYPQGGYEVAEAYRYYGQRAPFTAEAGERLQATMTRLVAEALA